MVACQSECWVARNLTPAGNVARMLIRFSFSKEKKSGSLSTRLNEKMFRSLARHDVKKVGRRRWRIGVNLRWVTALHDSFNAPLSVVVVVSSTVMDLDINSCLIFIFVLFQCLHPMNGSNLLWNGDPLSRVSKHQTNPKVAQLTICRWVSSHMKRIIW